ncbi:antA/AntB antirepressor family protein [Corynebacterium hindlerae]|uniref:antA/AntB antirepressor family protein n=1 Tax=Corynebacterium hindlerae TaxID=699041 RepID=UPI003AAF3002
MTEYGFTAGQDFSAKMSGSNSGRPSVDHVASLDMAKEISMIQRTPKTTTPPHAQGCN